MRNGSKKLGLMLAAALMAAGRSAQANLILDLKYSATADGGMKILMPADSNTDQIIQVWGTVIGTGTLGISTVSFSATGGGGAVFTGGVTTAGFSPTANFNNGAVAGTANGLGGLTGASARATLAPNSPTLPGYYESQGGWTPVTGGSSIELGTFIVHIGTLSTGLAHFTPVASGASWFENASSLDGSSGMKSATFSARSAITFDSVSAPIYSLTTHNNATLGTSNSKFLEVVGNQGGYVDPGPDGSYAPANATKSDYAIANANLGVGPETPVLVMVDFDLGFMGVTMSQLKANFVNGGDVAAANIVGQGDIDPLDQFNVLLSQYPGFDADAAHVLLFEFTSAPGAVSGGLHFGFDLTGSGVSVRQTIVVPEPASMALLALGCVGLLRRRKSD